MFKRIDVTKLHPGFYAKCRQLVAACAAKKAVYYAISGFRSEAEQAALYAIGRGTDTARKPVTNARPFQSMHNFGLAIDFCKDKDADREGLQPSWNIADYQLLADEALKLGLEPAFYWNVFKEGPHVQMRLNVPMSKLEATHKTGGIKSVWKLLR